MKFPRRLQIALALGLMVTLFAAVVGVNARLSWRPVAIDFGMGSSSSRAPHVPIAWHGDELWFLSSLNGVPLTNLSTKGFSHPDLRATHNWNRAPLPLINFQPLKNTFEGVGTLCAAHDLFAYSGSSGEIQIWRNKKLERTLTERGHVATPSDVSPGAPNLVSLSPDGSHVVGDSDLIENQAGQGKPEFCCFGLVLFDVASGRQIARQSGFEGGFSDVAWSPDSREFAGITQDGWVFILDGNSGKLRLKFRAHQWFGAQIAWSPDGQTLVTATNPRLMMTPKNLKFDLKSGEAFICFGGMRSESNGKKLIIATAPNGDATWNGRTERLLKRFDARTGRQIGRTLSLQTGAADMEFSPDGQQLAVGEHNFALVLNARTFATERRLSATFSLVTIPNLIPAPVCVAWSADSATLATSTQRGLTLWRMR